MGHREPRPLSWRRRTVPPRKACRQYCSMKRGISALRKVIQLWESDVVKATRSAERARQARASLGAGQSPMFHGNGRVGELHEAEGSFALVIEKGDNPLASSGRVVGLAPNRAALVQMAHIASFEHVEFAVAAKITTRSTSTATVQRFSPSETCRIPATRPTSRSDLRPPPNTPIGSRTISDLAAFRPACLPAQRRRSLVPSEALEGGRG
jgi:hypothetical protein